MVTRRVMHCSVFLYLDFSNGAATANRSLMECLARHGFAVEVLSGTLVDSGGGQDPAGLLSAMNLAFESDGGYFGWTVGTAGVIAAYPPCLRGTLRGVPFTVHHRRSSCQGELDRAVADEFLCLFDAAVARFRPDVLVTYGGDPLTREILARARRHGTATVFTLHNFGYPDPAAFAATDAVLVGSRFSAEHYRRTMGLECNVLPNLVDAGRVRSERSAPGYLIYVNPSVEKGVYAFARIADELGCRRPDIPVLVIESRGTETTLVNCGIDLRDRGNVFLMSQTPDPRDFWRVARICLMPSLWWENQPLVAVEAMVNGIPVIGSDRGGIPETLGKSGVVLPLPERLTPATRILPTAEEVAPWVEAIIRLWDDQEFYAEHSRLALQEARRWAAEVLEPLYVKFFNEIRAVGPPDA